MIKKGDIFEDVILETFHDNDARRIRVRPVKSILKNMRVEFPKSVRDLHPLGTRFSAQVKVSQKSNKKTGKPIGRPYLIATPKSIALISFEGKHSIKSSDDTQSNHQSEESEIVNWNSASNENSDSSIGTTDSAIPVRFFYYILFFFGVGWLISKIL